MRSGDMTDDGEFPQHEHDPAFNGAGIQDDPSPALNDRKAVEAYAHQRMADGCDVDAVHAELKSMVAARRLRIGDQLTIGQLRKLTTSKRPAKAVNGAPVVARASVAEPKTKRASKKITAPVLPKVVLTVVTNAAGLAVKAFWQDAKTHKIDGRSAASIYDGNIETLEAANLDEFMEIRRSLSERQALVYGITSRKSARLVQQRDLLTTTSEDAVVARTREFFDFRQDGPGILMLDFDVRPGHPPRHWKELDAILCEIVPGWRMTARVWTQSSTSSIRTTDGTDEIGMGGWRAYAIVDNAAAVPDVGSFIYQASWGAGHGYCVVSKSGQILDRSLTDVAVHQPERIDFAGPPHLGPGLQRTEVETVSLSGAPMLETLALKPKYSMAEWRKVSRKLKAERKALKGEAKKARTTFEAAMFAEVTACNPDAKADSVRAAIRRAVEEGDLAGHWPVHLHDGRVVTVADLFTDPDAFDGLHCADPMEPTYRNDNRIGWICMKPDAGDPFIYSHARGGRKYRLIEEAESEEEPLLPAPGNPMGCARRFVAAQFHHPERSLLIEQGGQFYAWDGTCYPPLDDKDARTKAYHFTEKAEYLHQNPDGTVERRPWQPTQRKVSDFVDALRAAAHIRTEVSSPSWLEGDAPYPASEMVACTNGLVHIPTRTLVPHTPRFYAHNAVPFAFEPDAPEPIQWKEFLLQLWPNDAESIRTLQEIFGYLVAGDTSLQKMFLLVGPKRGGKGTIGRVLKAMIGAHNVAGPTLSSLGTPFGLEPLIGKSLAIVSDARLSSRSDSSVVAERLLSISGEDTLTVDRKYKTSVTLQFPTRFVVLSNELPRLSDASGALASRFITLILQNSFYGKENPTLTQTLIEELPGIFNWALDGAQALRARQHFKTPKASEEAVRTLEDLGSPIAAFVREVCELGPTESIAVDSLYAEYRAWCTNRGAEKISIKDTFCRDLMSAEPGIKRVRAGSDGERFGRYDGIGRKVQTT
jgi:putative DNA primase/helicase